MSTAPTVTSMLEDLETHAEHPAAVLAIVSDLRALLGLPDERREAARVAAAVEALADQAAGVVELPITSDGDRGWRQAHRKFERDLRAALRQGAESDERLKALIHTEAIHAEEAEEWKP